MVIRIEMIEIGIEIGETEIRTGTDDERGPHPGLEMVGDTSQVDEIAVRTVKKTEKQKRSERKKERRKELLKKRNVKKNEKRNAKKGEFKGKKKLQ
jgi:hypothetical protein